MPVVRNVRGNVTTRQVLRREGVIGARPGAESQTRALLDWASRHLIEPAIAYEVYPVLPGGSGQTGPLQQAFPQAEEFAVAVCTIGPSLEREVAACFGRKEASRAVLLDAIGSAAVDALTEEACRLLEREAASRGLQASSPLSPGMPGLEVSEQMALVRLVPADDIGVSVTASGMMSPRKSASLVVGIGRRMPRWTRAQVCARCQMKGTCRHSVRARATVPTLPQPGGT